MLFHATFIFLFFLVFLAAFLVTKPFLIHKSRPVSTFLLKSSYLIYLIFFLIFVYQLLFGEDRVFIDDELKDNAGNVSFALVLACFLIPNLGILLRRKSKTRVTYNLVFASINGVTMLVIAYLYVLIRS